MAADNIFEQEAHFTFSQIYHEALRYNGMGYGCKSMRNNGGTSWEIQQ